MSRRYWDAEVARLTKKAYWDFSPYDLVLLTMILEACLTSQSPVLALNYRLFHFIAYGAIKRV
jgi:hypothetical protein